MVGKTIERRFNEKGWRREGQKREEKEKSKEVEKEEKRQIDGQRIICKQSQTKENKRVEKKKTMTRRDNKEINLVQIKRIEN